MDFIILLSLVVSLVVSLVFCVVCIVVCWSVDIDDWGGIPTPPSYSRCSGTDAVNQSGDSVCQSAQRGGIPDSEYKHARVRRIASVLPP